MSKNQFEKSKKLCDSINKINPYSIVGYFDEIINLVRQTTELKNLKDSLKNIDIQKKISTPLIDSAFVKYPDNKSIQFYYYTIKQMILLSKLSLNNKLSSNDFIELSAIEKYYVNKINDTNSTSSMYNYYKFLSLASFMRTQKNGKKSLKKSIEYEKKALEIKQKEESNKYSTLSDAYDQLFALQDLYLGHKKAMKIIDEKLHYLDSNRIKAKDYLYKVTILLREDKIDEAQKNCEIALKINPYYPKTYLFLANIYLLKNDINKCKENLIKAEEYGEFSTEFQSACAIYYLITGNYKNAKNHLNNTKSMEPNNTTANQLLDKYFLVNQQTE